MGQAGAVRKSLRGRDELIELRHGIVGQNHMETVSARRYRAVDQSYVDPGICYRAVVNLAHANLLRQDSASGQRTGGDRPRFSHGPGRQCRRAEPVTQILLQGTDRLEVLRRPRVPVRNAGITRDYPRYPVGSRDRGREPSRLRDLDTNNARPGA